MGIDPYEIIRRRNDKGIDPYERSCRGGLRHIRPKNKVASIVRSIKVLTTKEIGEPIFQRSYYNHVIRNQRDYDEIWQYIENNPQKWAIEKQGRD